MRNGGAPFSNIERYAHTHPKASNHQEETDKRKQWIVSERRNICIAYIIYSMYVLYTRVCIWMSWGNKKMEIYMPFICTMHCIICTQHLSRFRLEFSNKIANIFKHATSRTQIVKITMHLQFCIHNTYARRPGSHWSVMILILYSFEPVMRIFFISLAHILFVVVFARDETSRHSLHIYSKILPILDYFNLLYKSKNMFKDRIWNRYLTFYLNADWVLMEKNSKKEMPFEISN